FDNPHGPLARQFARLLHDRTDRANRRFGSLSLLVHRIGVTRNDPPSIRAHAISRIKRFVLSSDSRTAIAMPRPRRYGKMAAPPTPLTVNDTSVTIAERRHLPREGERVAKRPSIGPRLYLLRVLGERVRVAQTPGLSIPRSQ